MTLLVVIMLFFVIVFVFVMLIFVSLVDSRYRRLRVLLATKEIPGMRLDDFEVLHDTASAYTVYDVPIRMRSVVYALQIFVFTVMVGIYTAVLAEYR